MAHIVIKNVGALEHVDLDLKKINVFMGPQSSGKSTIAKIICHCQWVEKQCFSNMEHPQKYYQSETNFYDSMIEYHRLDGYFNNKSRIEYKGDYITIKYSHQKKTTTIAINNKGYKYPKLSYIPSERNIVAAIPNLKKYSDSNDVILYFMYDWFTSRNDIREQSFERLLNHSLSYKYKKETDYIIDNGKEVLLENASSGVQSLIPLYLVLYYSTTTIYRKKRPLSYEQKESIAYLNGLYDEMLLRLEKNEGVDEIKMQLKQIGEALNYKSIEKLINGIKVHQNGLADRYSYNYTRLFIEEPEQNLFPATQQNLIYWLLELLLSNKDRDNSLVLTTHSPYVLFAINNCMMGNLVEKNIPTDVYKNVAVHKSSWISPKDVGIYEIDEGKIRCIQDEDGIIEDNYLNQAYKENTAEYLSLLNYYDDED